MQNTPNRTPAPVVAVAYCRVSTVEQADSGLGLDAQRAALEAEAARRGWQLARVFVDAGASGATLTRRPELGAALERLAAGDAQVLLVAKLDRVSRSTVDAVGLLERSRREGWQLVALDLGVDPTTPAGEFFATMLAAIGQWERRTISARTREALAAARQRGVRLGRPRRLPDTVVARVVAERDAGRTWQAIAEGLNTDRVPTAQGGVRWWPATVRAVYRSQAAQALPAA